MKQNKQPVRPQLVVRVTEQRKGVFKKAAKAQGLTLSAWTIATLNKEAEKVIQSNTCIDNSKQKREAA